MKNVWKHVTVHFKAFIFYQNYQYARPNITDKQDSVGPDEIHPHARLTLLECGDVEQNPGPQVGDL